MRSETKVRSSVVAPGAESCHLPVQGVRGGHQIAVPRGPRGQPGVDRGLDGVGAAPVEQEDQGRGHRGPVAGRHGQSVAAGDPVHRQRLDHVTGGRGRRPSVRGRAASRSRSTRRRRVPGDGCSRPGRHPRATPIPPTATTRPRPRPPRRMAARRLVSLRAMRSPPGPFAGTAGLGSGQPGRSARRPGRRC